MLNRSALAAAIACSGTIAAGTAFAGVGIAPLETVRVASGMNFPVYATHAPGDSTRLFIIEKPGRIRILNLDTGVLNGTSFLDINSIVGGTADPNDERGLLGLAFHPDYQTNGFFYVNYTNNSNNTVVARYTVSANPDIANAPSGVTILTFDQPQENHSQEGQPQEGLSQEDHTQEGQPQEGLSQEGFPEKDHFSSEEERDQETLHDIPQEVRFQEACHQKTLHHKEAHHQPQEEHDQANGHASSRRPLPQDVHPRHRGGA